MALWKIYLEAMIAEESRDTDVQERIRVFFCSLEDSLGSDDFCTSLDGYDSFINDDEEGIAKGDPNEEGYQGTPDSPEIDEILDNSDEERAANSYDQYIGDEVVLHDRKGEKLMGKVRKRVRYDDT